MTTGTESLTAARPFCLSVDSGSHREPGSRHFATLDAALAAMELYTDHHRRYAWVIDVRDGTVHVKDGRKT